MNNYILTADGELYHYGVPGMKWGKRKALAEKKANKLLQKASNAYFRARDYQKIGNKKYAEAAAKNAERNIQKAKKMLNKVGSTRTDMLYGMANTKNGYEWWKSHGYETH